MTKLKSAIRRAALLAAVALAASLSVTSLSARPAKPTPAKAAKTITGAISGFDCGDNCYLTIQTAEGEDVAALCHAKQCAPWVEEQALPKTMMGRKVRATLGKGKQLDGSGAVMGEIEAFTALKFVK